MRQKNNLVMREQFFGKAFWIAFGGLVVAFVLSYLSLHNQASTVLTIIVGIIALVVTVYKLEFGLLIALTELIGTSHGHLFSAGPVSVRMAIFAAVMLGWVAHLTRGRRINLRERTLWPYYALVIAAAIGFFRGWQNNVHLDVINDGNAYFFLAYIFPVLTVNWTAFNKRLLLQVIAGATSFVTFLTLAIMYLFTHLNEPIQRLLYTFFRDDRVAELTRVTGDIFRVFLQAQFFDMIWILVLLSAAFWMWKNKKDQNAIALWSIATMSAVIICLSRSFWMGIVAGTIVIVFAVFKLNRPTMKELIVKGLSGGLILVTAVALLWTILAFPLPKPANVSGFGGLLSDRTLQGDDAALSSRWKLLPAMMKDIAEAPLLGSGFGTIVAYQSDDPRVRAIYPDGMWRTYSLEWGWQELWLKMGLLGPIAFIWLIAVTALGLIRGLKQENAWLNLGLLAGLVALCVTQITSPYLNHPIGLGFLIFLTPFLTPKSKTAPEGAMVAIRDVLKVTSPFKEEGAGVVVASEMK